MSSYYLINSVRVGTYVFKAGNLFTDAADDVTGIRAAGGILVASTDATVAAAAVKATRAALRGASEQELTNIMTSASFSAENVDLASTASGYGASLVGLQDNGGLYTAANVEAALAEVKTLVDAGMTVSKRTVTIGHADLTDAVNGEAQAINIGAVLPANCRIVGCDMRGLTVFTGGSVSAVTCDIGTSGDVDAIVAAADLQTTAVDGGPATMPKGVRPNKTFATLGAQLIATFHPDGGHALLALSAGSVTIDVLYVVLA